MLEIKRPHLRFRVQSPSILVTLRHLRTTVLGDVNATRNELNTRLGSGHERGNNDSRGNEISARIISCWGIVSTHHGHLCGMAVYRRIMVSPLASSIFPRVVHLLGVGRIRNRDFSDHMGHKRNTFSLGVCIY